MNQNYLEKVYSGFIGMNVGIRLGAPVEPTIWSHERIYKTYGDITDYVKEYKNFAADDDANGPVYFLRALDDEDISHGLTPQHIANTWLNYTREGIGMFWWGGYGVSTEHTAYLNLLRGVGAPASGSYEVNGKTVADQIGGQIFIDTWGLVSPHDYKRAAEYAKAAASVSHDGEGVYGAMFMAAAISHAFDTENPEEIINVGLEVIPNDSEYAGVTRSVMEFHKENPENFRDALDFLHEKWGYDKYPGIVHIIPNAGVCILSLLYGKGDFNKTVEIATMCGWDTDCNAGNVGTIMGVAKGLQGIDKKYRDPINDFIVLSGISGYLNILDIPTYSKKMARHGYELLGEEIPKALVENFSEKDTHFDFELPGSTHNFRVSDPFYCRLSNTKDKAYEGERSLEILFDRMVRGQRCKVYYKPFYRREDFSDERYMPVFSPKAYAGQEVRFMTNIDRWNGESMFLSAYVRNTTTKEEVIIESRVVKDEGWVEWKFIIPELDGAMVDEIGLIVEGNSPAKYKDLGTIYLDDFSITGKAKFTIEIKKQSKEFASITPFSHNHGAWEIEGDHMSCMCLDHGEAFTGNYFLKDVRVKGSIIPLNGSSHLISARVQGALRGYYGGFTEVGKVGIMINNHGMKTLVDTDFDWKMNQEYTVELKILGEELVLKVDGIEVLKTKDHTHKYGMVGYAKYATGRSLFGNLQVEEL